MHEIRLPANCPKIVAFESVYSMDGDICPMQEIVEVAEKHGLDPVHMAMAWCTTRPFMASVIFGATSVKQLDHILGCVDVTLSDEVMADIDKAHRAHPMPY